jgi:hypothetical protein
MKYKLTTYLRKRFRRCLNLTTRDKIKREAVLNTNSIMVKNNAESLSVLADLHLDAY